jgi:transposase
MFGDEATFHQKGGSLMNYVGIDYHKKYSQVTAIDEEGKVVRSMRLENKPESFQEFFKRLDGPSEAVLEAYRTWGVMYDLLEDMGEVESVELAHSLKVRAIAEAKIKTDKIDSHILAQLLRADLILAAYIPGKQTRSYKEMIRQRIFLVRMWTRLKNRIHVLLDRLHIPLPSVTDIFGKRGTNYLRRLNLPGVDGEILRENLQLLETLNTLIKEAEGEIESFLGEDPRVKFLRTVPGFGPFWQLSQPRRLIELNGSSVLQSLRPVRDWSLRPMPLEAKSFTGN